jgi:galactonate dehydratase
LSPYVPRALEARRSGSVSLHCPSGPVSLLASAHVMAAAAAARPLEHAVHEVDWRAELLDPPERSVDGALAIPAGAGLGATLNRSTIARRAQRI